MHKSILEFFNFLKNCVQFLKIVVLFLVLMLILYWIQDLIDSTWAWTSFLNPLFDVMLDIGEKISSGSIMLFAAVFEFKYLIAMLILGMFYAIVHFGYMGVCCIEDCYNNGRKIVRKMEENHFNKSLEKQNIKEQKKLRRFQIYVETFAKPKFAHREYNIDMNEQNQLMVKFLIDKTKTCPEKKNGGYLFTFESFGNIDTVLDIFKKLPESTAPIDYIICVQVFGDNLVKEQEQLNKLIELKILNKITSFADTAYRYGFNQIQNYDVTVLGVFQKDKSSFEVHQFQKKTNI